MDENELKTSDDFKDIDTKLFKYTFDDSERVDFTPIEKKGITYIWFGINSDKAMFTIAKLAPTLFKELIDADLTSTSWDIFLDKIQNLPNFNILFNIIISDVAWDIFKNNNQN